MSCDEWDGVQALVERARAGDRDAQGSLCALVQPYLQGLVQKLLGRGWAHESLEDLSQVVWFKFAAKISDFRGGCDDANTAALLRAWLGTMVANESKNYVRHKQAKLRATPASARTFAIGGEDGWVNGAAIAPPAHDPTPSLRERLRERAERVERALARLPDDADRQMVGWHFVDGWPYQRIADRLGRTYEQVRYRMDQIKQLLETELASGDDDPRRP